MEDITVEFLPFGVAGSICLVLLTRSSHAGAELLQRHHLVCP